MKKFDREYDVAETDCDPTEYTTFIFGLMTTCFRSSLNSMMGVPKDFESTPEYKAGVAKVWKP